MRKYLVLTGAYPDVQEPGRAVFVQHLSQYLSRRGSVHVICPQIRSRSHRREREGALVVERFPYYTGGKRLKAHGKVPWLSSLSFLLSGFWHTLSPCRQADVMVAHWALPAGLLAWLAQVTTRSGIPYVLYAHGSDIQDYAHRNRLFYHLTKLVVQGADLIYCTNSSMKDTLEGDLGGQEVRLLPCGVHPVGHQVERSSQPLVVFVGDLSREKGAHWVMEAAEQLLARGRDLSLVMVGDGPLRNRLEEKAAEINRLAGRGTSPVKVLGVRPHRDVRDLLGRAHLFVLPSRSEGCSVAAMEALWARIPVVGSDIPGFRDLVEPGVHGELVPLEEMDRLADHLEAALDRYSPGEIIPPPLVRPLDEWGDMVAEDIEIVLAKKGLY